MRTKLLAYSDYCTTTGFSNVMSNILSRLDPEQFELTVLGVGFRGDMDYDQQRFPGKVYTARSGYATGSYADDLGRQKFLELVRENDFDVVFVLQDTFVMQTIIPPLFEIRDTYKKPFKLVYYFPVDCPPQTHWIERSVAKVDIPVAYTHYGREQALSVVDPGLKFILEDEILVIPHGINFNDYYQIEDLEKLDKFRETFFLNKLTYKFLLANINRNQPRKDLPRSMMVLRRLREMGLDNVVLYLHASDADIGGDLSPIANSLGLTLNEDYFQPTINSYTEGYPVEEMNLIYNCAHAVISTTTGEGWGLSLTEGMAAKIPVVAPRHSSISEILDDGRGILCPAGNTSSLWTVLPQDHGNIRPLVDVDKMAEAIYELAHSDFQPMVENAYEWARSNLNWDDIVHDHWVDILTKEE